MGNCGFVTLSWACGLVGFGHAPGIQEKEDKEAIAGRLAQKKNSPTKVPSSTSDQIRSSAPPSYVNGATN